MLEADRARRTMTAGAIGGRKGGTASANKRLRKALKDSPRVKVVASAPANAKERRGAARQQPAPLLLDAKALEVLTTQVVVGVLGSLTLTNKQRSLCTVAAAAAATAVGGHAIGQIAGKVAGGAQLDSKTAKTVIKGAERTVSDNDTGRAAKNVLRLATHRHMRLLPMRLSTHARLRRVPAARPLRRNASARLLRLARLPSRLRCMLPLPMRPLRPMPRPSAARSEARCSS